MKNNNEEFDVGEMWKDYRKHNQVKKESNNEKSLKLLKNKNIEVIVLNEGNRHYRIGDFDFWATTGKYYNQKTKEKGRGVFNLIKLLEYIK